jgi:hypothetical protein
MVKPKYKYNVNKLIRIRNEDKDTGWAEKWQFGDSLARIPHPMRICNLGNCGRGKTNTVKNIVLAHQGSDNPFKKMYVLCNDAKNSKEWADMDPTEIFDEVPDPQLFDGSEKTIMIIDDFELTKLDKESYKLLVTIFRFCSTHRNLSLILNYQSFFDTPPIFRKLANVFIIYAVNSVQEIKQISNRVGVNHNIIKDIFKNICTKYHDSLMIDLTKNTPCKLRKNVFECLDDHYAESSESDE